MKLTEGYYHALLHVDLATPDRYREVETLAEANGVGFVCPRCTNHVVICWFTSVPQHPGLTGPGRWTPSGSGLADLSLSPSVWPSCGWHGWVRDGDAA